MTVSIKNVCSRQFEASHGKAPRGSGRWGFIVTSAAFPGVPAWEHCPAGIPASEETSSFVTVPQMMTFSQARSWVVKACGQGFVKSIEVAP